MEENHKNKSSTLDAKSMALLLALILGGFVRLEPVLSAKFPLKDGGLFFTFINALLQNQFSFPDTISYNGLSIPFVYPPLSFYISALVSSLFHIPVIDLLRILPAVFSILTIAAFYRLAKTILASDWQVCFAVLSFALLPTAIDFMIVGGGLPRALGYFFAILALQQIWLLSTQPTRRHLLGSILWVSLTVLSHPVVAKFLVYSAVLIFLFNGRNRKSFFNFCMVAAGTLLLTSPWWILAISRHGFTPFLNALQANPHSWTSYLAVFLFMQTNEPYLHLQGFLALIGVFVCLKDKQYFLPAWLGVVFILEPRLVASYAILPTSLLVAIGLEALVGMLNLPQEKIPGTPNISPSPQIERRRLSTISTILLAFILCYGLISAFVAAPRQYLDAENIEAMTWIKANLPKDSRFLVISGIYGAGEDYISEWFPTLSGSVSLATPQGREWVDGSQFIDLWQSHDQLQECQYEDQACLENYSNTLDLKFTYIYMVKNRNPKTVVPLILDLNDRLQFITIYENDQVIIFRSS